MAARAKRPGSGTDNSATVSRDALLVDGSDAAFRVLLHDLLAFANRLETIRGRFGEHLGLSGPAYTILIAVDRLEGEDGVGVSAVAAHLGLSGAFVTSEVGKLVRAGLLSKETNPEDLRRVLLRTTGCARERLGAMAAAQREINDTIFSSLDQESFDQLRRLPHHLRSDADRALPLTDFLLRARRGVA